MIATADLKRLRGLHKQRANVQATRLELAAGRLRRSRAKQDELDRQIAAADASHAANISRQLNAAQTPAHLTALPLVLTLLKLRHEDHQRLLKHQRHLVEEEIQEVEAEHAEYQKAVFGANAKVEKFTSICEQIERENALRAEDAADEEMSDEQNQLELAHET